MTGQLFYYLVLPLIITNVIVLVHLSGHFIAARVFGVGIETVSLGLGPRIFGFSRNGTSWKVCWLPVGGYVRPQPANEVGEPLSKKIGVALSGPVFNIAFAFVVFFTLYSTQGVPTAQGGEVGLVQLSVADGFLATARSLVWTWTTWSTDQAGALASVFDSPASRLAFLAAILSSKFGVLNLLPLPKFDGWSILRLTLTSTVGQDKAEEIMKWMLRLIITVLVLWVAYVTWKDLVFLGVLDFLKQ